jgi:HAD superfamily hydrolase (TIGR01509 family)
MLKVKAVLFDFDGTVVEYKIDIVSGKRELRGLVRDFGLGFDPTRMSIYHLLAKARKILKPDKFRSFKEEVYQIIDKYEIKAVRETDFRPNVLELLGWLRKEGIKLAIITNNSSKALRIADERLGLSERFDLLITRDLVDSIKPEPEGIRKALRLLRVKPGSALMVGDSPLDILAARNAGVLSVAVPINADNVKVLADMEPDFLVGGISEIKDVILYLNSVEY